MHAINTFYKKSQGINVIGYFCGTTTCRVVICKIGTDDYQIMETAETVSGTILVDSQGRISNHLSFCGDSDPEAIYGAFDGETCNGNPIRPLNKNGYSITVSGLGGNDEIADIAKGSGVSYYCGNDGNDTLSEYNDYQTLAYMHGNNGDDILNLNGGGTGDRGYGGAGADQLLSVAYREPYWCNGGDGLDVCYTCNYQLSCENN